MKSKILQTLVAVSAFFAASATADKARVATYTTRLQSVRVTEIARETASLVTAEKPEARVGAATDAVTAAVSLNSPSTPLVVGAVAKAAPETAATAAATALKAQPSFVGAIARAAVSAAPSQIDAIVGAMCQARPTAFYAIGVSAAEAAPKSSGKVLPAITMALPALKPLVARAQADFAAAKRPASLALVLKHTEDILARISRDAKESPETLLAKESEATMATKIASAAAVFLPPFTSGPRPGEIPISGTQVTNASGRVYSTP